MYVRFGVCAISIVDVIIIVFSTNPEFCSKLHMLRFVSCKKVRDFCYFDCLHVFHCLTQNKPFSVPISTLLSSSAEFLQFQLVRSFTRRWTSEIKKKYQTIALENKKTL